MIKKLKNALKTICDNPLLINAYVEKIGNSIIPNNWGDDINYHFIKHLTKREVAIYFDTPIAMALKKTNYLCIGSTLNYLTTRQTVVWGAGVIDNTLELRERPACVHAVRGPLTREYLLSRGIDCPEIYGDPALLIPYFYKPTTLKQPKRFRLGIIPHYADWDSPVLMKIKVNYPDIDLIDITSYGDWTDLIDRICACDAVLSSSLHGLIVAESFGIANHWVTFSDRVLGNGFKFRDFYASIGKSIINPVVLDQISNPIEFFSLQSWTQGKLNIKRLLEVCPFKIKEPIRYEHPMDL